MQFRQLDRAHLAPWAPLLLRLIVGYGFAVHGLAKLARGPDSFAGVLHSLGVPAPHLMAWATMLTELLGGIAIALGALVTFVSVPLAVILLVAIFTVHLPYGFSSIKLIAVTHAGPQFGPPGYECNLLYLTALAALVLGGPGPLAIDGLLRRQKKTRSTVAYELQSRHPKQTLESHGQKGQSNEPKEISGFYRSRTGIKPGGFNLGKIIGEQRIEPEHQSDRV